MVRALVFGAVASGALVLGALVGGLVAVPKKLLAAMLAFAAGALITALAFEMFEGAVDRGGIVRAAIGVAGGAGVFPVVSAPRAAGGRHGGGGRAGGGGGGHIC